MDLYGILQNQWGIFLLILTRTSGIFILAPFLGSMNIPVYIRAGSAFAFAVVLFPVVSAGAQEVPLPETLIGFTASILMELFVGWLIGFVGYLAFSSIHFAGSLIDMQIGFSVANVIDPTSGQHVPLVGSFLYNLALIIFLVTNSHHIVIAALYGSFEMIPLNGVAVDLSLTNIIINFVAGIFVSGLKIALPILFAVLLTDVGLGILARTMPQMNIFVVGIPAKIVIGLVVLTIALPFYILFLDVMFNEVYGNILLALRAIQ